MGPALPNYRPGWYPVSFDFLVSRRGRPAAALTFPAQGERLRIRLTAPPADNRTNEQLVNLAGKTRVIILRGRNSRTRTLKLQRLARLGPGFP